jgi:hypothetical protein
MNPERKPIEDKIDAMFGTGDVPTQESSNENTQQTPANEQEADADSDAQSQSEQSQGNRSDSTRTAQQPSTEHKQGRQSAEGDKQTQRRLPANNNGDLTDPNTGAVIAKAGNERRFFEGMRSAREEAFRVTRELDTARAELTAFREAAALPRQLELTPQETTNALQWFAHWKKDPQAAAKEVLTEARRLGYDVEGMGSQVDMGAIKRLVEEAVSPFQQDRAAAQRETEIAARVDADLNALYQQMPWARSQQEEIMSVMQADNKLTLREAALTVEAFALRNGLDLQKSIRQQWTAAQSGGNQQQPRQQRPNNARAPAPPVTGDMPVVPRRTDISNHDVSNRNIVKQAMRDAGFAVDHL